MYGWPMRSFALAFALACLSQVAAAKCIGSGDQDVINRALSAANARAVLCQKARFLISKPILLTAPGQELTTEGSPAEPLQATIKVSDAALDTAIFSRASNIHIHHIRVDGSRQALGRINKGGALIEIGGSVKDIAVDHVRAFDPRGWSTLHVFEGQLDCAGAKIVANILGPAGNGGGEWADGVSFACRNGLIANNRIVDATDGAIVIFGAPGTKVLNNVIISRSKPLLGGINLVDYRPFSGDYTGTVVQGNSIKATPNGLIKVAIAVGPAVWGSNSGQRNRGGIVIGNHIQGRNVSFGIAADGADNFRIEDNDVTGPFFGQKGPHCIPNQLGPGIALARNSATTTGSYSGDFEDGPLRYSICMSDKLRQVN